MLISKVFFVVVGVNNCFICQSLSIAVSLLQLLCEYLLTDFNGCNYLCICIEYRHVLFFLAIINITD